MSNVETEKIKALQEHWKEFHCEHSGPTELRKRIVKGGGIQFVEQCLRCGAATTSPLAREKAIEKCDGVEPPPFDETSIKRWAKASRDGADKIMGHYETQAEFELAEFHKWYEPYLQSDAWKAKRDKVFARAKSVCEGCGETKAEAVHHLTYRHVGEEFLFELVALCDRCHERYHKDQDETQLFCQTNAYWLRGRPPLASSVICQRLFGVDYDVPKKENVGCVRN